MNAEPAADAVKLRAESLQCYFTASPGLIGRLAGGRTRTVRAVEDVSFDIRQGETFSLVGESGCGKSTVARLIVGLYGLSRGRLSVEGKDLSTAEARKRNAAEQAQLQMIFQDPYASLNPRMRVRNIIAEPIRFLGLARDEKEVSERIDMLLRQVGLAPSDGSRFPHEFSGGQRQRIGIARALMFKPKLLIADEAVSALDVSIQAQILQLLDRVQRETGVSMIFITHDLRVASQICDEIAVMQKGEIVEQGPPSQIFLNPQSDYTRELVAAIPGERPQGQKPEAAES